MIPFTPAKGKGIRDPISLVEACPDRHPRLPVPRDIYGVSRVNPLGRDLSQLKVREHFASAVAQLANETPLAGPIVGGQLRLEGATEVFGPSRPDQVVGKVAKADRDDVEEAITRARAAQPAWDRAGGTSRAVVSGNDIVVTARKRTETLQDIPSSIAALGGEQLDKLGADSLEEFAGQTPGLSMTGNRANSQVVLRGVTTGPVNQDQAEIKETVGMYLDETPKWSCLWAKSSRRLLVADILTPNRSRRYALVVSLQTPTSAPSRSKIRKAASTRSSTFRTSSTTTT